MSKKKGEGLRKKGSSVSIAPRADSPETPPNRSPAQNQPRNYNQAHSIADQQAHAQSLQYLNPTAKYAVRGRMVQGTSNSSKRRRQQEQRGGQQPPVWNDLQIE